MLLLSLVYAHRNWRVVVSAVVLVHFSYFLSSLSLLFMKQCFYFTVV